MRLRGVLCGLVAQAAAQIRIISPPSLSNAFSDIGRGRIDGSTSTFGAPFYGSTVLGRLVWSASLHENEYCAASDYELPPPVHGAADGGSTGSTYDEVKLIDIVMVRRGKCSFTTKVRVAAEKGAHAVIIVDKKESTLKAKDMQRIIVADDGFGDKIRIPSILISKEEGEKLIKAFSDPMVPIIVELKWDIPTDHVVAMDLWMSSASSESQQFLKEFAPKRRVMNEVIKFRPHYHVFSIPTTDINIYNNLCLDSSGEFCAEDPDGIGKVTGKDVLDEDVRQLCIHELTKLTQRSRLFSEEGAQQVEYAKKYWEYVERLPDRCPLAAANDQDRFGTLCSRSLMSEVGIDVVKVAQCVETSMRDKLKKQKEFAAWSPKALRINGWRYSGLLDANLVSRAICSGFIKKPRECEELLRKPSPFVPVPQKPSGVSLTTFFEVVPAVLLSTVLILMLAGFLYKHSLKNSVRATLREEVMLEVQAQMGEYKQMGN